LTDIVSSIPFLVPCLAGRAGAYAWRPDLLLFSPALSWRWLRASCIPQEQRRRRFRAILFLVSLGGRVDSGTWQRSLFHCLVLQTRLDGFGQVFGFASLLQLLFHTTDLFFSFFFLLGFSCSYHLRSHRACCCALSASLAKGSAA